MRRKVDERFIVAAIDAYQRTNGYAPTYRDLMRLVGLASVSSTAYWLMKLREQGLVTFIDNKPRTLRITSDGYDRIAV